MHAQFGARQNVNQTRKMGVCPPSNVLVTPCGLTSVVGTSVGMGARAPLAPPSIRRRGPTLWLSPAPLMSTRPGRGCASTAPYVFTRTV